MSDGVCSATPVSSLQKVHERFGSFVAVECADFDIPRGEFFSPLGALRSIDEVVVRLGRWLNDSTYEVALFPLFPVFSILYFSIVGRFARFRQIARTGCIDTRVTGRFGIG